MECDKFNLAKRSNAICLLAMQCHVLSWPQLQLLLQTVLHMRSISQQIWSADKRDEGVSNPLQGQRLILLLSLLSALLNL